MYLKTKKLIIACAILSASIVFANNGLTSAQIKKDLAKNKPPLTTLDMKNNRWKALRIGINAVKQYKHKDYAKLAYGKAWDFSLGMPDTLKGKLNVKNFRLENGILKFTTDEDAEIFWGDHRQKKPEFGEESIGKKWSGHWYPIWLELKIKQSLPISKWHVQLREGNKSYRNRNRRSFTLKGTQWQTLRLPVLDSRAWYASLALLTSSSKNNVQIKSVSIYTPTLIRAYQKTLKLDSEAIDAAFSICTAPEYKVFINDKLVCQEEQGSRMSGILNRYSKMEKYFHKGENTISVEAETCNWSGDQNGFVMEGAVYSKNGKINVIKTDSSWKGQYLSESGTVNKQAWSKVKILGRETSRFEGGRSAYFLNPPYYGRIKEKPIGHSLPIFRPTEKISFAIKAFGKNLPGKFKLVYKITDALDSNKEIMSGVLLKKSAPIMANVKLSFLPPHPGVYNIKLSLLDINSGKELDSNTFEAVSVGKIKQKEISGTSATEGLELKLIDSIDCTKPKSRPMYCASSRGKKIIPKVTTKAFGKYLESGNKGWDFLSWKLEFPNHRRPFMLEIDYPDDSNRITAISLGFNGYYMVCNDHGNRDWPYAASGYYTGFQHPISNKMRTLRMVFYPKAPLGTITIGNALSGGRAAVAAIRLYAIENDLPALKIGSKTSRITGVHAERITEIPNNFYNGDMDSVFSGGHQMSKFPFHGFYKAWYTTNVNLIKYMRFCGENSLIAGLNMYADMHFPSSDPSSMCAGGAQADMAALLGEMFAANDLTLLLGVEYSSTAIVRQTNRATNDAIAKGAFTQSVMDKNGKQVKTWHSIANINDKVVQDGFFRMINDICRLYKNNPGIKGLFVQEQENHYNPCFAATPYVKNPLDFGYSDTTIAVFEKETGVKVPVPLTDPKRFSKRYDWLTKSCYDKWVNWRCAKIHDLNAEILNIAKKANDNWTVTIIHSFNAENVFDKKLTPRYFQKRTSFYPPLYKEKGFIVGRTYIESIRHQASDPGKYLANEAYADSPEVVEMFNKGFKRTAIQTGPQFYEPHLILPKGSWYWDFQLNGAYCMPPDDNISRMYNRLLYNETPYFLVQYWTDMNLPCGFEQERRLFNRAFTAIPEGKYKTLKGNGLDANTLIRAFKNNVYIINLLPVELKLTLHAKNTKALRDLAIGKIYKLKNNTVELRLRPNSLNTFKLQSDSPSQAKLTGAKSTCPKKLTQSLKSRVGKAIAIARSLSSNQKHSSLIKSFIKSVGTLNNDLKAKRYGKILMTLNGGLFRKGLGEARGMVSPVNWWIIGPFDNAKRRAFEKVLPVEKDLHDGIMEKHYTGINNKKLSWRKVVAASSGKFNGIIDLIEFYGGGNHNYQLSYAMTQIYVDKKMPAKLLLGSDDGLKVWLNSKKVFSIKPKRGLTPEENSVDVVLNKGWNQLVLKIENNVGGWGFALDIKDRNNKAISSLKYARN